MDGLHSRKNCLPDAIFMVEVLPGNRFVLVFANSEYLQHICLPGAVADGSNFSECLDDDQSHILQNAITNCITGNTTLKVKHVSKNINGEMHWFTQLIPLTGNNTEAKKLIGISKNITAIQKQDSAAIKNKILLTRLFELFPTDIFITNEDGFIIECNAATEKTTGFSRDQLLHINVKDGFKSKTYRADYTEMPLDEIPAVVALQNKTVVENVLMGFKEKEQGDTEMKWIKGAAAYINLPGYGVIVTGQHITNEKQQEQYDAGIENNLQVIVNSSPDHILFLDTDNKVIVINQASAEHFKKLTGKTLNAGDDIYTSIPEERREIFNETINQVKQKQEVELEHKVIYPDGDEVWFCRKYYPVFDEHNHYIGYAINAVNINKRKEIEQRLAEQNAQLKEIARIQSHELRRPLANILGLIFLLTDEAESTADRLLLDQLKTTAENLDGVIKKITMRTKVV